MIEYFKYTRELRRLNNELNALSSAYDKIEEGYKGEDDQGHLSYLSQELDEFYQWIEFYKTSYLKSKADKLLVPMPDARDTGMYSNYDFDDLEGSRKILTTKGIHHLKTLIREEQKAKREVIGFWFTITTGLVGAIIGLVSVLKA